MALMSRRLLVVFLRPTNGVMYGCGVSSARWILSRLQISHAEASRRRATIHPDTRIYTPHEEHIFVLQTMSPELRAIYMADVWRLYASINARHTRHTVRTRRETNV